ncbi:MAG: hypothetical protein ABIP67_01625 [Burkholderiales bacterium]
MSSDTLITKVRGGMRIISADGVSVGTVWRVHFRDTETCIEVRPQSLSNALLNAFTLRQEQTNSSHLFVPGRTITQIAGKRVHVQLDAEAVSACVTRPPWIEHEEMPPTGFNTGRPLD